METLIEEGSQEPNALPGRLNIRLLAALLMVNVETMAPPIKADIVKRAHISSQAIYFES